MEYRRLGTSDLSVSEISLGSWLTISGGVSRERAVATVDRAFDLGINFIDTANAYGRGAAESLLGEVLEKRNRDSYVLATKAYFPMSDTDKGLSAAQIRKQVDGSLQRLRVDHIDLYQCHRFDTEVPLEETMGALTEAVQQGKVRYLGFSMWSPQQIQAAADLVDSAGVERFVSSQPVYNVLVREQEDEVFPLCDRLGVGQIVFSPLAQGVLTGKYQPGEPPPEDSRAASDDMGGFMGHLLEDRVLTAVQDLRPIADDLGLTVAQLSLAWVLRTPSVASAIVGASRPEQLDDNAAAAGVALSPDVLEAIDAALAPARA